MTMEVRVYHLLTQSLEQALPALLMKALSGGRKAVVRFGDASEVSHFNAHFWTYTPESFLPHGAANDAYPQKQPVYLTDKAENPNEADMLLFCNQQAVPENIEDFALCCDFIDGRNDQAVEDGRVRWKHYKEAGYTLTYWQQTETGGWEQKA